MPETPTRSSRGKKAPATPGAPISAHRGAPSPARPAPKAEEDKTPTKPPSAAALAGDRNVSVQNAITRILDGAGLESCVGGRWPRAGSSASQRRSSATRGTSCGSSNSDARDGGLRAVAAVLDAAGIGGYVLESDRTFDTWCAPRDEIVITTFEEVPPDAKREMYDAVRVGLGCAGKRLAFRRREAVPDTPRK
ncbi:hypothetical protein EKO27_g9036 [Xylaria grammica]|uniref:Uncharacterized protein n=1 Tax=Xylaria grammica TaxID=363999 RepID=A0A439CV70_9PEZI|nr:hypothetical protein EKO27_g9036 [Xylaria grammica]